MRYPLLILGLALAAGAASHPAMAQSEAGAALARVDSGKVIRARLEPDRTVSGAYVPIGDGRLGIRSDLGATDTLRLADVRELAVRGRNTKTGAIVGGIAGVGFGVFLAWVVTHVCDAADCDGSGPYVVAVPLFGAGGTLLGAAIGAAIPRWKRVFP